MTKEKEDVTVWYWIVTASLLLWNLIGVAQFMHHVSMTEEALQALPQMEQELYAQYPLWTKVAFGIAVFTGTLACVGLLLKRKWSKVFAAISFVALVLQMYHSVFIAKAAQVYGPIASLMPVITIAVALFIIWTSNATAQRGWLQ